VRISTDSTRAVQYVPTYGCEDHNLEDDTRNPEPENTRLGGERANAGYRLKNKNS
jgi:hypothetical protein